VAAEEAAVLRACDRLAGFGPAAVGRLAAGEEAEAGDEEDPASEAEVYPPLPPPSRPRPPASTHA
jgi:hypothetical protein